MNKEQIIYAIKTLAQSQGFYSRLYRTLCEAKEADRECFLNQLEAQNFNDTVDLVLYLES